MNTEVDLKLVSDLVRKVAHEQLLPCFNNASSALKEDGSLVTEADLRVNDVLGSELRKQWPDIPLLSEEMSRARQEQILGSGDRYWVLDPLDGTTNFDSGIPIFAISLALFSDGRSQLGLVYDPMRDEMFAARRGQGAWLNGQRLRTRKDGRSLRECVAAVDFKRLSPELAAALATKGPYRSQRNVGTVVLEWCWLAANRFQLYLHGGQKLWDYAAGELIFSETGGLSCSLDGEPVAVAALGPRSVAAATSNTLFKEWSSWVGVK